MTFPDWLDVSNEESQRRLELLEAITYRWITPLREQVPAGDPRTYLRKIEAQYGFNTLEFCKRYWSGSLPDNFDTGFWKILVYTMTGMRVGDKPKKGQAEG